MAINNIPELVDSVISKGITLDFYTYVYLSLTVIVSAVFGSYFGNYFKTRGEQKAINDSFYSIKEQLKHTTIITEEIKSNVTRSTIEHQIKFSKLHDKKIETIQELYRLLCIAEEEVKYYLHNLVPTADISNDFHVAVKPMNDFITYSKLNEFWLDENLYNAIEEIAISINQLIYNPSLHAHLFPNNIEKTTAAIDAKVKSIEKISKEIPQARAQLIKIIRLTLNPK